jgi:phage-related baseplate assembly protein
MANFATQQRSITAQDYIIRAYSMPSRFGSVAKAYVIQDQQLNPDNGQEMIPNPLAINLYTLGYDGNGNLTELNAAVKENLKTYINQYRLLTDTVNIKTAYVINIGVKFEIITLPEYNSNEVLLMCIEKLKNIFNSRQWQINQPIVMSKIYTELDRVEGVQSVTSINIVNLYDSTQKYSGNVYDIAAATKAGVIYPSLDPSIFEIKFPNTDIIGKVISL